MAKVALLIGVSEYEPGLNPLPASVKDMQAIAKVLQNPEMGGFAEADIQKLENPDPQKMQEAIETLFSDRRKDDLAIVYFSGHGIKDESGKLYLATRLTRKNTQGQLIKSTAVPASFIHNIMSESRSKRLVIILDCCFSGAFAEGWSAKDDGSVNIQAELGCEGRVVLTSSTSTQYSFQQEGANLSTYTRYLVEGIETGAADLDNDGVVSVDELHEYAKKKVKEAAPAMQPEIYAVKEGFKIFLAKAPIGDPKLRYRKEVEIYASRGEISNIGRKILDTQRQNLGLLPEEVAAIETEVLKPYREYQQNLQEYQQALIDALEHEQNLSDYTRQELRRYQEILKLRDEDITSIEAKVTRQRTTAQFPDIVLGSNQAQKKSHSEDVTPIKPQNEAFSGSQPSKILEPKRQYKLPLLIGGGGLFAAVVIWLMSFSNSDISNLPISDPVTYQQVTLSSLILNNQGKVVTVSAGEKLNALVNYFYNCPTCQSTSKNQIIVGIAGEDKAQACIYDGGIKNSGSAKFTLTAPNQRGTYYIRFRYAQAFECNDALGWWKVGDEPPVAANIGLITVK
ncbi:caspase family protein [Nostoc sp.]|uniref:caspase family protein n=1 Tax=Nostoc sp. TaxID=1180 RepID=UPI002FFD3DE6